MAHHVSRSAIVLVVITGLSIVLFSNVSQSRLQPADTQSSLGKSIYQARCSTCHGNDGKGNGYAAAFLNPRPRNFTEGKYKFRSTETGTIPTDADLEKSIKNGLHGTSMPDWEPFIKGDSLSSVIAYMKSFSPRFQAEQPKPVKMGTQIPSSAASIEAGKKVFENLQCGSCHGTDGAGKDATATDLVDDWNREIAPTNLTEPWTFRGGATPQDIYLRFRTGIDGTPMPSFVGSASDQEMWHLANYVVSLGRKPVWKMTADEIKQFYSELDKKSASDPVARGKYLVRTNGCADCHTPTNEDGSMIEELRFAGGVRISQGPYGDFFSYNLTSDKETGLGNWSDAEIKQVVTRGTTRDGRRLLPFTMPWTSYSNLKEEDLNAIIAYLRTIPPIYNKIPEPKPLNVFSYLWGKFKMLILQEDFPSIFYPGNAGTTKDKPMAAHHSASSVKEAGL